MSRPDPPAGPHHSPGRPGPHDPGPGAHDPGPGKHHPGPASITPGPASITPGPARGRPASACRIRSWPRSCPGSLGPTGSSGTGSTSTWPSTRCGGTACRNAVGAICGWIRQIAAYERAPQKYHHTVSRAWVELVAHHVAADPDCAEFDVFANRNPALLNKRLLSRHYRSSTLAAGPARRGWVEPDLLPFPWPGQDTTAG